MSENRASVESTESARTDVDVLAGKIHEERAKIKPDVWDCVANPIVCRGYVHGFNELAALELLFGARTDFDELPDGEYTIVNFCICPVPLDGVPVAGGVVQMANGDIVSTVDPYVVCALSYLNDKRYDYCSKQGWLIRKRTEGKSQRTVIYCKQYKR